METVCDECHGSKKCVWSDGKERECFECDRNGFGMAFLIPENERLRKRIRQLENENERLMSAMEVII